MKSKKESFFNYTTILASVGLVIFKIITLEINVFPTKFMEIIFVFCLALLLFLVYKEYKNRYRNLGLFLGITFLVFGFLPYCHYLAYSIKNDNYNFTDEYLKNNVKLYKLNLENYKDSSVVSELYSLLKSNKIDEKIYDSIQSVGNYNLIFQKINHSGGVIPNKALIIGTRPNNREINSEVIISKNEKEILKLEMTFEKLKLVLANYIERKNEVKNMIKTPEKYVPFNDFWIDSVTGFAFSFIKPISKASQIIRLIQFILLYFFLHMFSSLLKISKELEITKIKK